MENIKNSVTEIKSQIRALNIELEKLQSDCNHPEIILKYNDETKNVLKVCNICEKIIGYPNTEELKESDFI